MAERKYRVICTGEAVPGREPGEVKEKLAGLLKKDVATVGRLLAGRPVLIRKNLDAGSAERWKAALEAAGALCRIERVEEVPPPGAGGEGAGHPAGPSPESDSSASEGAATIRKKPRLVSPEPAHGAVAFAPKRCPKITGFEGGINLNRADAGGVFFDHIRLLSAYSVSVEGEMKHRLLIFLQDQRRPFVVESTGIRYRDFPDARSGSVLASLRNFLIHLVNHNPGVAVDEATWDFLEGGRPRSAGSDETALATSLGKLLLHGEQGEGPEGTAPAPPPHAQTGRVARPVLPVAEPSRGPRMSRKVLAALLAAVGTLVAAGIIAALLVPAYYASKEVESADALARAELANACAMAMKHTIQHPEVVMTKEGLAGIGYAAPEDIELTVVDGRWDSLSMRARHSGGSTLYASDKYCYVTEAAGR
jgi:hypothetical protein